MDRCLPCDRREDQYPVFAGVCDPETAGDVRLEDGAEAEEAGSGVDRDAGVEPVRGCHSEGVEEVDIRGHAGQQLEFAEVDDVVFEGHHQ